MTTSGELAYTAYGDALKWVAPNGDPLPSFAHLRIAEDTRQVNAWERAAAAVRDARENVIESNKRCALLLASGQVRIDQIFWMAGEAAKPSEDFANLLTYEPEPILAALELFDDGGTVRAGAVAAQACRFGKLGFLVQVSTPIIDPSDPTDMASAYAQTWSECRQKWFYVDALNFEFVQQLMEWVKQSHRQDRTSALKEYEMLGGYQKPPAS